MPTMSQDRKDVPASVQSQATLSRPGKTSSRHRDTDLPFGDDEDDDVTAPARGPAPRGQYMNQSIFGMIATAGSKTDLNKRFDESSDSDHDNTNVTKSVRAPNQRQVPATSSRNKTSPAKEHSTSIKDVSLSSQASKVASRPETLTQTSTRSNSSSSASDGLQPRSDDPHDAPMMSRLLTAEARFEAGDDMTKEKSKSRQSSDSVKPGAESSSATLLATRLMDIFRFTSPEPVLAEYHCWLLQSVMLEGYLYLTQRHICFYAYVPKQTNTATKTGFLSKRGKSNPRYRRYWFELKGDVLSYFSDPSNKYFPRGTIDLRYAITATIAADKDKDESSDLTITTDDQTYYFRADSASSAKEWVKTLQKNIFRSRNDGDSVKISLSIEKVLDVEESPVVEVAETIRVRVIDDGDTYAIDEYFFAFFGGKRDIVDSISRLLNDNVTTGGQKEAPALTHGDQGAGVLPSAARISRRNITNEDSPEREGQTTTAALPDQSLTSHVSRRRFDSTESHVTPSIDRETDSSLATVSPDIDARMSASQILSRSDVFHAPVVRRMSTVLSASSEGANMGLEDDSSAPSAMTRPNNPRMMDLQGSPTLQEPTPSPVTGRAASPSLQEIMKAGSYPLQRAGVFAGYLKNRSSQMSRLLATESMSYLEKVSGMWSGSRHHYGRNEGIVPDDQDVDPEDEEANVGHGDRFRTHFALPQSEKLQATYFGYLHRVLPLYGKLYISNSKFCFRSLLPGTRTKLILPLKDIENVDKEKGFRFGYHGLVLVIRGHEELFFEFNSAEHRDDCTVTLLQNLEAVRYLTESVLLARPDAAVAEAAKTEHDMLQEARRGSLLPHSPIIVTEPNTAVTPTNASVLFDDGKASIINFKPAKSLRITCLTIGSRGDVQPYIALCKGLLAEGHKPRIATHAEFGPWCEQYGIEHVAVGGDPAELMRICVENGMFTYSFLREATTKFRTWVDDLLTSAWQACQGSDVIIESPSAMAGIHIAEALGVPYFRAFTMPWTRTRAYPHAFAVPDNKHGGAYNLFSYVMFDNVFWKGIAGQINRWRKRDLGLRSTSLEKMQQNKVPFLYNYSPHVVPPPLDYSDWVRITGYWFLDEGSTFNPPADMLAFIKKARADRKKLVYIGFGSIVVSDPKALTRTVVESVLKADVRCILSKGWSDRLGDPGAQKVEVPLPEEILQIKAAPHDWLFSQLDAAVHHGGAGTTGASLRAGIPTVAKPFFGDQFFFGSRIEDLGVGICLRKINVSLLARALWEAVHSERMIAKARILGERIRKEDGVHVAIQALYRDLEYARDLVVSKKTLTTRPDSDDLHDRESIPTTPKQAATDEGTLDDNSDESWTFVMNK